ncbi:uncharacterized protein LOC132896283 isoform X2 [Neoarius graeffei]|uniref:uncharacterized protein LOC132896283 isoform X2 n=1 Tax=Neoarius graeffei TaxID=443677 RepID=UPI00298D29FD|nr:uncharacterized protein LOC132896283 isoform X2 [Neoarius graeffei]
MKILLIVTLYLISGPVDCFDVTGFSGGSVIITSDIQWNPSHTKYICKMGQSDCNDIIRFHSSSIHVQYKRFLLYRNAGGVFLVLIRKLKPQDAGTYRFGVEDQRNYTVSLTVRNGTYMTTSAPPSEISSGAGCSSSTAIASVCVCVVLLLIGGFALIIYKLRCKRTQASTSFSTFLQEETE